MKHMRSLGLAIALSVLILGPSRPFGVAVPTVGEPAHAYFGLDCVDVRNNMVWASAEVAFWTVSSHPSAHVFRQMALTELAYWTTIYLVEC
ncbi:MAG: hypothetical protein OXH52_16270 [Gammaproteobacteria bacterium]|nr:hypothetical protein [Gammaproteobacteria bacterium]